KLGHDLGSSLCKIFAAWRGITLHDGLATYDDTYGYNQYGFWKGDRRGFVLASMRELCRVAEDNGIILAMQNHGSDIVNRFQDVLELIEEVGSPVFKACMDINIEPEADSPQRARNRRSDSAHSSRSLGRFRSAGAAPDLQYETGVQPAVRVRTEALVPLLRRRPSPQGAGQSALTVSGAPCSRGSCRNARSPA